MSEGKVQEFRPRKYEKVWECGSCGGQKFFILESMRLECTSCGETSTDKFVTNDEPKCQTKP